MRLTLLPDGSQTYDIKRIGVRVSVGRKQGCDITLSDIVVSGLHCYITVTSAGSALIEDVSTNGTYLNGIKIGKGLTLEVKDGDVLTLGKPSAGTGSVSFKLGFTGFEDDNVTFAATTGGGASAQTHSVVYKQEIEDLKVLVSQAQHRSEMSERRAQEATLKLSSTEGDLKRTREDNVELTVRNDVMRSEIETLRTRLSMAERAAADSEKKYETLQVKVDYMNKEFAEISALKAALNLKHTSLAEEIERLRRENTELSSRVTMSSEVRKQLLNNLLSAQHLISASAGICENLAGDTSAQVIKRIHTRGYPMMEPSVESAPRSPEVDKFFIGSVNTVTEDPAA